MDNTNGYLYVLTTGRIDRYATAGLRTAITMPFSVYGAKDLALNGDGSVLAFISSGASRWQKEVGGRCVRLFSLTYGLSYSGAYPIRVAFDPAFNQLFCCRRVRRPEATAGRMALSRPSRIPCNPRENRQAPVRRCFASRRAWDPLRGVQRPHRWACGAQGVRVGFPPCSWRTLTASSAPTVLSNQLDQWKSAGMGADRRGGKPLAGCNPSDYSQCGGNAVGTSALLGAIQYIGTPLA